MVSNTAAIRRTDQYLAPVNHSPLEPGIYDIYPGFHLPDGQIFTGFNSLAGQLAAAGKTVVIDGFGGILWQDFRERLDRALTTAGHCAAWRNVDEALLPAAEIEDRIKPFLGGNDPIFGTRYTGLFRDFFDADKLSALRPDPAASLNILYGCGAALAGWEGTLVYLDVPKNEIQFRSRAGSISNLGKVTPLAPKVMYKQFYFVDWVVLSRQKMDLLPRVDVMVDMQRIDEPVWMTGANLRAGLDDMGHNFFRVRPWFEPGPWGGNWIKQHIPQLPLDVPNYAWSFELIVPENGLMFQSSGRLLEVSFDMLMFHNAKDVLGDFQPRFGTDFPIRYDFLDTVDGGNLSVQCHPTVSYTRKNFGENFTQDEAYYILDAEPGAQVNLGFQPDIQPDEFRAELEKSYEQKVEIAIDRFVNHEPSTKHDLFLIPNGTIHGAGIGNLVLEISATPYIFTFKMYDWMRLDLDGNPRPLNIARAFENLNFERKGNRVRRELVSHPYLLQAGAGWKLYHLPTHPEHFYDVHRVEFDGTVELSTNGSPQVLSLVEGERVTLETSSGSRQLFNYAETFVIPAAAGTYRLINETGGTLKAVITFLKPGIEKDH
jgi:mannose-6-phosphate isomerase class I